MIVYTHDGKFVDSKKIVWFAHVKPFIMSEPGLQYCSFLFGTENQTFESIRGPEENDLMHIWWTLYHEIEGDSDKDTKKPDRL